MKNGSKTRMLAVCAAAMMLAAVYTVIFTSDTNAAELIWDPVSGALGYKIYYSVDSAVTTSDPFVDVGNNTLYELCTLPLEPCLSYYLRVAAYNAGGEIFTGSVMPYANNVPQIMAAPGIIDLLHDRATIQWTTDVPATSVVSYGTTVSYGSEEASPVYVTGHSVLLSGLTPNTTYHFKAASFDPDNCGPGCNASNNSPPGDQVFTTPPAPDLAPPVIISGPTATAITETTAVIEWTTDENSTSSVYFDTDGSGEPYAYFEGNTTYVTSHSLTLSGLTAGTLYYCRVGSTDVAGNGPAYSDEMTFTTQTAPIAPPSGLRVIQ